MHLSAGGSVTRGLPLRAAAYLFSVVCRRAVIAFLVLLINDFTRIVDLVVFHTFALKVLGASITWIVKVELLFRFCLLLLLVPVGLSTLFLPRLFFFQQFTLLLTLRRCHERVCGFIALLCLNRVLVRIDVLARDAAYSCATGQRS